jgi:hypothetical protein
MGRFILGSRVGPANALSCKFNFVNGIQRVVVEVAGIEPASEGLQQTEPTCVSDPFSFADAAFESAGTKRR